ncbi:MAG: rhomboid family intramembrane serine protease [Anaerolineales bacterium]|nr:rhomboid family intramembrane serine protease [Anaerolineales bacterium]
MRIVEQPDQEPGENPTSPPAAVRSRPSLQERVRAFPVTFSLIGITLVVFLGQVLSDTLLGTDLVLYLGAKYNPAIRSGQWWRFITPVFIHGGLLHFGVNMYSLYIIGPAVERFFKSKRFLFVYLLSGIGGVVLSFALSDSLSVGASGAIFGLIGALGGFFYAHRKLLNVKDQLRHLITVTVLNLTLGLTPGIDNWGHIGGLVTGAALSWWLGPRLALTRDLDLVRIQDQRPFSKILPRAGTAVVVLLTIITLLIHYT